MQPEKIVDQILEASYSSGDIPRNFYVAMNLTGREGGGKLLAKRIIPGIKGISDKGSIIWDWFNMGARDVLLIMDGKATVSLNKISRIGYDNPDYLVANNLSALYRLWNQEKSDKYSLEQVWLRFYGYIIRALKASNQAAAARELEYNVNANVELTYKYAKAYKISGVRSLAKFFTTEMFKINKDVPDLMYNEWLKILKLALKELGSIYQSEGEWLIKDKILKIPSKAELLVARPDISSYKTVMGKTIDTSELLDLVNKGATAKDIPSGELSMWFSANKWDIENYIKINNAVKSNNLEKLYKIRYITDQEFAKKKKQYITTKYR